MTALHVSRCAALQLTEEERRIVAPSIQQFQLGEGSTGQRLLERGARYAREIGDPHFVSALELFIKEEQQHSRYLAAFMQSQSIPLLERHWVDTVFRKIRGLAGLELSLTVLVIAEMIAVPYYRALRRATNSPILKLICTRLLEDEASHLRYQASILARMASARPVLVQRALGELQRLLLLGTVLVVWREHRAVFEAAGYGLRGFESETLAEFHQWNALRLAWMGQAAAHQKPLEKSLKRTAPEM
jgi:1,2-phenylacetyl-CoA epoxidase catalytic subunit